MWVTGANMFFLSTFSSYLTGKAALCQSDAKTLQNSLRREFMHPKYCSISTADHAFFVDRPEEPAGGRVHQSPRRMHHR